MKTLMCQLPNPTDATSLYRGVGPLQSLRRRLGRDLHLVIGTDVNWATLKGVDAVFMQRPAMENHVKILKMAQANRKPVWVDYDDDLYRVPLNNRTHRLYSRTDVQNNISTLIAKADVVSVSTPQLAANFAEILQQIARAKQVDPELKLNPSKIVLIPNAYDTEHLDPLSDASKAPVQHQLVCWRGSGTHDKDLMTFTPELCRVVKRHLDWTFNFVGEPFWWTLEQLDQVEGIKPTSVIVTDSIDPIDYFGFLKKTLPALMIVPLEDNPFNRAKSNIAWVEATHAGAVALAPDWPEWQRPGIINYKDPADFEAKLESFLRGEIDGAAHWRKSRDFILENLTLPKVNRLRELIVRDLMEKSA